MKTLELERDELRKEMRRMEFIRKMNRNKARFEKLSVKFCASFVKGKWAGC
jgi:hypothetical protein